MRYISFCLLFFCLIKSFGQDSEQFHFHDDKYEWQERIIIQTNKNYFIAGETLRFGLTCLLPDNSFSKISKVGYVEIIDEERKSVLRQKIELNDGIGSGDLYIPSILKSGNYVIIAYTRWMRNFSHDFISQVGITIINPFKPLPLAKSDTIKPIGIKFYPESKYVTAGISNQIVYEIDAPDSMHFRAIKIINQNGKVVHTVNELYDNLGRFAFTPQIEGTYTSILIDDHQNLYYSEIDFRFSDYIIQVELDEHSITICPHYPANQNGSIVIGNVQEHVQPGLDLKIDRNDLEAGINNINLLLNEEVVSSRSIFINPKHQKLEIKLNKDEFHTREENSFIIKPINEPAHFKVIVRQINELTKMDYSMQEHFQRTNPFVHYPLNQGNATALDNSVIIHQSSNTTPSEKQFFLPEMRGATICGSIKTEQGAPFDNMQILLSLQTREPQLFSTSLKRDGSFSFIIPKVYGIQDGYIYYAGDGDQLTYESPYIENYEFVWTQELSIEKNLLEPIRQHSILVQLSNAYFEYNSDAITPTTTHGIFYGKPSSSYIIDDYTPLPTMKDIFVEYVTEVSIRKVDSRTKFSVSLNSNFESPKDSTLLLLNGIPISDPELILSLKPPSVNKIDILNQDFVFGNLKTRGIIHVYTKQLKLNDVGAIPNVKRIVVNGIQNEKSIFNPDYSNKEIALSRLPDLRNELFWDPFVTLDTQPVEVSFHTSDIEGEFEVVLSGITSSGKSVNERKIFLVKN